MNNSAMRKWFVGKVRGTKCEEAAFELDERICEIRGIWHQSFRQYGEDRIVLEYMSERPGVYIDVGANYPIKLSNTYLLYRYGWNGLTIEPIPRLSERHRRIRPRDTHVNAAVGLKANKLRFYELNDTVLSTFDVVRMRHALANGSRLKREHLIEVVPLHELIHQHLASRQGDLLTVDTEGFDLEILQSNDWTICRPRIVIFESNERGLPQSSQTYEYLKVQGYTFYGSAGCNVMMTRSD